MDVETACFRGISPWMPAFFTTFFVRRGLTLLPGLNTPVEACMEKILYCLVLKNKTRKNPKYYLRIRQEGHRDKLLPLATTSRPEAELRLRAAQRAYDEAVDLERQGIPVPPDLNSRIVRVDSVAVMTGGAGRGPMSVRDAVGGWESWMRVQGMSERTLRVYTGGVLRVLDGNLPVASVDRAAVVAGMSRKASLSSGTRRALSNALRSFLRWLNDNHGRSWEDAERAVPVVRAVYRHKKVWSDDEVRRILSCVSHRDPVTEAEYKLFFTIQATTGCRDFELRALRWEDFGPDRIRFVAQNTKSRTERTVPVNRTVQELAAGLREASGEVFPHVARTNSGRLIVLRRAMYEAGISEGSMHSFRSSLATRWSRRGVPVRATQQLLGHSSAATTLSYYVEQDSVDTLAKFVETGDVTKW